MRRNRRDSMKRERIIMIASSAFVLTALTATGLYMKGQDLKQQDDGYTLDFSALENRDGDKIAEIGKEQARKSTSKTGGNQGTANPGNVNSGNVNQGNVNRETVLDNDLDYMPAGELSQEAGSHLVEIPGLTDTIVSDLPEEIVEEKAPASTTPVLNFEESQGLTKPVNGEILLPYSMSGSIYFATLDQYKYNPATVFSAEEGSNVIACADGKVTKVFQDAELGTALTLDLGNGYTVTYGQLADLTVAEEAYVNAGDKLGTVAAPSKYYVEEGSNLYFKMEKDGSPVNAESLF